MSLKNMMPWLLVPLGYAIPLILNTWHNEWLDETHIIQQRLQKLQATPQISQKNNDQLKGMQKKLSTPLIEPAILAHKLHDVATLWKCQLLKINIDPPNPIGQFHDKLKRRRITLTLESLNEINVLNFIESLPDKFKGLWIPRRINFEKKSQTLMVVLHLNWIAWYDSCK